MRWTLKTEVMSDARIIEGLQCHDKKVEHHFFDRMQNYFDRHFSELFFDPDSKQEIFQTVVVKLWTEIENGKIKVLEGRVCRQQKGGEYLQMTASLSTFLMTFARNEYRELLRDPMHRDADAVYNPERHESASLTTDDAWTEQEERIRVVDECIQSMSPRCTEILTLFYYQQKSLDEIMVLCADRYTSKDGLKTAKNKCMNRLRDRVSAILKAC